MTDMPIKDATPEQLREMKKRLRQQQENRKDEIEINQAIALVRNRGKRKLTENKKEEVSFSRCAQSIGIGSMYCAMAVYRNTSIADLITLMTCGLICILWGSCKL